jgi:transposase-like protein
MSLKRVWKPEDKLKVLQEVEQGSQIVEVCRKYQIDPRMYYNWKERYQKEGIEGLKDKRKKASLNNPEVSKREYLKLQKENEKLKRILADKELAIETLKEMLKKIQNTQRERIYL